VSQVVHDKAQGWGERWVRLRDESGEVFKTHRLLYHSTLGLRVITKKKKSCEVDRYPLDPLYLKIKAVTVLYVSYSLDSGTGGDAGSEEGSYLMRIDFRS